MTYFRRILVVASFGMFSFYTSTSAQVLATNNPVLASDPQAISLAAQSIAKMTGGTTIRDATLTGSVTWNGTETGTATLKTSGLGETRLDLNLPTGVRTDIRDVQTGKPMGQWMTPNRTSGSYAFHNAWTDAAWFFPALGTLNASSGVSLSYLGQEVRKGVAVQHLQTHILKLGRISNPRPQQLGTTDFYLDATTLLPVALKFNAHPDKDMNTDLSVEVEFSSYLTINGILVPTHIQRRQDGSLIYDLFVSSAALNTGVALSTFAINSKSFERMKKGQR